MTDRLLTLHHAVQAAAPGAVVGVAVLDWANKATWRVDFVAGATADQRNAALEALAAFDASAPTADDVRAECRRRMRVLLGARDDADLDVKISNGVREAVRLQNIRVLGGEWTQAEAARAATLAVIEAAIEQLRARSNAMETSPPADFADNSKWV